MTPRDFRTFVQDLALIRSDGTSVPVQLALRAPWQSEQVALLDFENAAGSCSDGNPEMNTEITGTVPAGDYQGLSFTNGVPEDLNHDDPATLPDPLKTYVNLAWGWLAGFRFVKLELNQVVPAGERFATGFVHTGAAACTGNAQQGMVQCAKPNRNQIKLEKFDASSNTVLVDIGAAFKDVNLSEPAECHGTGPACEPMFSALGIDYSTGQRQPGQTVFKQQ